MDGYIIRIEILISSGTKQVLCDSGASVCLPVCLFSLSLSHLPPIIFIYHLFIDILFIYHLSSYLHLSFICHLSTYISSIHRSIIHLLPIHLPSTHSYVYLPIQLSFISIYQNHPFICPSILPLMYLLIYIVIIHLLLTVYYLFIHPPLYPSIHHLFIFNHLSVLFMRWDLEPHT